MGDHTRTRAAAGATTPKYAAPAASRATHRYPRSESGRRSCESPAAGPARRAARTPRRRGGSTRAPTPWRRSTPRCPSPRTTDARLLYSVLPGSRPSVRPWPCSAVSGGASVAAALQRIRTRPQAQDDAEDQGRVAAVHRILPSRPLSGLRLRERSYRGAVQNASVDAEARAMTGAVPCLLG